MKLDFRKFLGNFIAEFDCNLKMSNFKRVIISNEEGASITAHN